MKCSKCKEEILKYGRYDFFFGTRDYWGECDCSSWKLVRCD